jgi:hypothetical protein
MLIGAVVGALGATVACGGEVEQPGGAPAQATYEATKQARLQCVDRHKYEVEGCKINKAVELQNTGTTNPRWAFDMNCTRKRKGQEGDWVDCASAKTLELRMGKWVVVED